jgi:hypothetical protein
MPNGMQYLVIDPGHADQSLLRIMAQTRGPDAGAFEPMPPIVSHLPDPADLAKVEAWINAL